MARFGDGVCADADLVRAAEAAARQAVDALHGLTPDIACVFVCGDDVPGTEEALSRAGVLTGAQSVIGCTASGVIGGARGIEATSAVSVWVGVLPGVRVRTFHLEVMRAEAGLAVIGMPEHGDDDAVGLLLADPWSFPVDGFIERSNDALDGLPFVGGIANGPTGSGSTRLLIGDQVVDRGAVGAVLTGPVAARTIVSQGSRPVGPAMTVTAAEANVLLALAGKPAVDKLEEVLAALPPEEQAMVTAGLQIGIAMDEYAEEHGQGDYLVRAIMGLDRDNRGIVVGDALEVGNTVCFHVRDAAAADIDLTEMLDRFRGKAGFDTVEGALLFTCNGRGAAFFPSADHDVLAVRRLLATEGVAGFFAAGEIGPVGGRNHVHGLSASVLAFGSGHAAARGTEAPG